MTKSTASAPQLSIVVPMYNVERYVGCCIDSLLAQTIDNYEIILVDDGSPDSSGSIAEQYAANHTNITVIHQKNAGLGPARNTGIQHAKGEYIGFVDSDDWVMPQMYEHLLASARKNNADIVFGAHRDMTNGKAVRIKPHPLAGTVLTNKTDIMNTRKRLYGHGCHDTDVESFPMRVWTAIYRREFIERNHLTFQEILSEDTMFNLDAYACANVIAYTGDTEYCYRVDDQPSITNSFSSKTLNRYINFIEAINAKAQQEADPDCSIRASRTAVDYSRLFVGAVANSSLSKTDKKRQIRLWISSEMFGKYCHTYPLQHLPLQQRIFHMLLLHNMPGLASDLCSLRNRAK